MFQRVILYKSDRRLSRRQLWGSYIFFYFVMLAVVIWASVYLGVNYDNDRWRHQNITMINSTITIIPGRPEGNFSIVIGDHPDTLETLPWIPPIHIDEEGVTYESIYNISTNWNLTMNLTEIVGSVVVNATTLANHRWEEVLLPDADKYTTTRKNVETVTITEVPEATEDNKDPVARIESGASPVNRKLMEPSRAGNPNPNPSPEGGRNKVLKSPEVLISSPNHKNSVLASLVPEKKIRKREDEEKRILQVSEIPMMKSSIMTQVSKSTIADFNSENFSIFSSRFGEDKKEFPGINVTNEEFIANGIVHYNKSVFRDEKAMGIREGEPEGERESDGISLPVELIRSSEAAFHRHRLNSWEAESASRGSDSGDKITDAIFIESSSLFADDASFGASNIGGERRIEDGERAEKVGSKGIIENDFDDFEPFVSQLMTRDDSRMGLDDFGTLGFVKIESDVSQKTVSHSGGVPVESYMSSEAAIMTQVSDSGPRLMTESDSDSGKNQKVIRLESMINPEFESSSRMTQVDENLTQGYKSNLQLIRNRVYNTLNDSGMTQLDSDLIFDSKLTQNPSMYRSNPSKLFEQSGISPRAIQTQSVDSPNDSTFKNSPKIPKIFSPTSRNDSKLTNHMMSQLIPTTSASESHETVSTINSSPT